MLESETCEFIDLVGAGRGWTVTETPDCGWANNRSVNLLRGS